MDNKIYCVWCGAEVSKADKECASCSKKLPPKDKLFLGFLIDHTKESIKGNIEDKVFETLKNFLLSHLFGAVVALSIIVVAAVGVFAPKPYSHIKQVGSMNEAMQSTVQNESASDAQGESVNARALTENDKDAMKDCVQKYVASMDYARFQAGNDAYLYAISDDLYYSLPREANYDMYYDCYEESIFPYVVIDDGPFNTAVIYDDSFSTEASTDICKDLQNRKFEFATAKVTHYLYAKNKDTENPVGKADYFVTFAKENGKWLIVETTKIQ